MCQFNIQIHAHAHIYIYLQLPKPVFFESGGLWECVFGLVLQYVVGANSSYTSSCLMPLPRCSSKGDATRISWWGGNSIEIDYYILVSQISWKQLQMQSFKHPCAFWGIHLSDIVLPWQKSSLQNRTFIYTVNCNFLSRQGTSLKKEYPYKIESSPLNMQRSFL